MLAATTKMPCAAEAMSNFSQKKGDRKISKNQKEKTEYRILRKSRRSNEQSEEPKN